MKTNTLPWHNVVRLRAEIRSEEVSQKQFAADLYDVMLRRNPGVYQRQTNPI
jgi:hypothetical protein